MLASRPPSHLLSKVVTANRCPGALRGQPGGGAKRSAFRTALPGVNLGFHARSLGPLSPLRRMHLGSDGLLAPPSSRAPALPPSFLWPPPLVSAVAAGSGEHTCCRCNVHAPPDPRQLDVNWGLAGSSRVTCTPMLGLIASSSTQRSRPLEVSTPPGTSTHDA